MWIKRMLCGFVCSGVLLTQAAALAEVGEIQSKAAALYAADGTELYSYQDRKSVV